jgi:hypothetical protein
VKRIPFRNCEIVELPIDIFYVFLYNFNPFVVMWN